MVVIRNTGGFMEDIFARGRKGIFGQWVDDWRGGGESILGVCWRGECGG